MKNQNKKRLGMALAFAAFVVLGLVLVLVWHFTRPAPGVGEKHITVEVVHKDGGAKTFTYDTGAEYLGAVLTDARLIQGEDSQFGLYVKTVDGETVDGQSWWALSINGEFAQTGVDTTPVRDGDVFTWTYTALSGG